MKKFAAILTAVIVGAAFSYGFLKLDRPESADAGDTLAQEEIARLQTELKAAQAKAGRVETIVMPTASPLPPDPETKPTVDITPHITALKQLDPKEERVRRRAIYHLEAIAAAGSEALPAITRFFEEQVDLDFNPPEPPRKEPATDEERRREEWRRRFRGRIPGLPSLNRTFPATLRLGLIETTTNIGEERAEKTLLNVLETTAHGVEVAYLAAALEKLAPGKHVNRILAVAREILSNPPEFSEQASALDRRAQGYLYALLIKHRDLNFVDQAKTLLITPEGALDSFALSYLRQVLGGDAMPILLATYKDPRITDPVDKNILRDSALRFIGSNDEADQIFMETVKDGLAKMKEGDTFDMKKYEHIGQPLGALMRDVNDQPIEVIVNRRKLLGDVRKQSGDLLLSFGLNMMDKELGKVQKRREEAALEPSAP